MPATFPSSLITPDSAAGHALARLIATQLLPMPPSGTDMATHLRTPGLPGGSAELVTAIYFHAITVANHGWNGPGAR